MINTAALTTLPASLVAPGDFLANASFPVTSVRTSPADEFAVIITLSDGFQVSRKRGEMIMVRPAR